MALEFDLNHDELATLKADCIVVGAFADKSLTTAGNALDSASKGRLKALLERGDASGKAGKTALVHDLDGVTAPRVLVVGLGDAAKLDAAQYLKAVGAAAAALKTGPVAHAVLAIADAPVKGRDGAWAIRHAAIAADRTISSENRIQALALLAGEPIEQRPSLPAIVSRGEAARLIGRTRKRIDQIASAGFLTRVPVPGSKRALGFSEASVRALLEGRATQGKGAV